METIFGIEMNSIMVVVLALFFVCMASVAFMAVRNPLVFKLGVRSVPRRRGQTVLIVVGLMLSTLIISAAFATGDTVTNTIRHAALKDVGSIDETIKLGQTEGGASEYSNAPAYFSIAAYDKVRQDTATFDRIDGVLPVISEAVPAVDKTSRQTTPTLFIKAFNSTDAKAFGELSSKSGANVSTTQLAASELYLNEAAAKEFSAQAGNEIQLFVGQQPVTFKVKDIVKDGSLGDAGPAAVMSLSRAQTLFNQPGKINRVWISNLGGLEDGAQYTPAVVDKLKASVAGTDLQVTPVKQDALNSAEVAGSSFASIFTIFGLFSIMAGVLLIFLIFVMLAAERKSEMGMARAVGIQRGDIIRMFLFEGTIYDLAAALVGVAMGLVVSFLMVLMLGSLFAGEGLEIAFRFTARTVLVSYGLGMLITFLVVTISAWRVSRLNIVSAIRDLPEYQSRKEGKRGLILGILGLIAGAGITWLGISGGSSSGFSGGVSIGLIGLTLVIRWVLRRRGTRPEFRDRIAFTFGGVSLLVWWMLPFDTFDSILPKMSGGIEGFFLSGVMMVAGGIWTIIFNYDILLTVLTKTVGRIGSLGPVLKTAVSYPMTYKFRTGLTLAMFSLIVFTLIVMTVLINTQGQTLQAADSVTGGYDLKAQVSYNNPIKDINASIASSTGLKSTDFEAIGAQTNLPIQARQVGASKQTFEPYYANLADDAYLNSTGYKLALRGDGFKTDREVWESLKSHPEYAVVDSLIVPSTMMGGMGAVPIKFKLEGFYLQDKKLPLTQIEVKEPRSGFTTKYTVVGVVEPVANAFGIYVSHSGLAKALPASVPFTTYFVKLKPGVDAAQTSQALESQFLENGLQSTVLVDEIKKQNSLSNSMNLLMEGFMALGLLVGVAALGVISMRAVVERRQEIGVLRAIGYQPRMVQLSFLTESSFVTLLGVTIGVALGLGLSYNLVSFMAKDVPVLRFEVPWLPVVLIVAISYVVSLSTTYFPSRQAARIYPAEALRYE